MQYRSMGLYTPFLVCAGLLLMLVSLRLPLPPPRRLSSWAWLQAGEEKERAPEFLEHVVLPDDTLVGICLKYKVRGTGMPVYQRGAGSVTLYKPPAPPCSKQP